MSFLSPNNSTVLGDNQVPWDNNIVVQIICSIHMNWAQLTIFLPFFSKPLEASTIRISLMFLFFLRKIITVGINCLVIILNLFAFW